MTEFALKNPLYVWLLTLICVVSGWYGLENIGRLEDPPFPIKQAFILTQYPGASALEVEQEISEKIELSLRELPWISRMESRSVPGHSEVEVELHRWVTAEQAPQIWDELRRRVSEAAERLPPEAQTPHVEDDFSDVYGILYAVTMPEGYSIAELHDAARLLQSRLQMIKHVAKVQIDGLPEERVYLDFNDAQLIQLGISRDALFDKIRAETALYGSSSLRYGDRRMRIAPTMPETNIDQLGKILVGHSGSSSVLPISALADISRVETDQPKIIIRHNNQRVFTLGVSVITSANVVSVGKVVEQQIYALKKSLPVGMDIQPVYEQHRVVDRTISRFLVNLSLSIFTVIMVLCLFTGWRAGLLVGAVLLVTVLGTIGFMAATGIQLHRISLAALMISMGMLVDNAIVVAEGMVTGMQRGQTAREAAIQTVVNTRLPLLGATIVGMAAFSPIGLSSDSTGQFMGSLFYVAGGSLLLSWILSVTLIPSLGIHLLRPTTSPQEESTIYNGWLYKLYSQCLSVALNNARLCFVGLLVIALTGLMGFSSLKQGFFPNLPTPVFYVDLYFPEGTDLHATEQKAAQLESKLAKHAKITDITAWVGRGASRFTVVTIPERPNQAYAQFAIRAASVEDVDELVQFSRQLLAGELDLDVMVRRAEMTPGGAWKLEARFSGDNTVILRSLAQESLTIYQKADLIDTRSDWRQPTLGLAPTIDAERAQASGVDRQDIAEALAFVTTGSLVAVLRDSDKQVPIIARSQLKPGQHQLLDGHVWSRGQQKYIPLRHVITEPTLITEDATIIRRSRSRALTAQANPAHGSTAAKALTLVRADIEAIELPEGYTLTWGGEYEANQVANESLGTKFPLALLVMVITTLVIFGRIRQTIVAWSCLPLLPMGVLSALLITQLPFNFPALLGLIGLIGMLLKNAIVMIGEIDRRTTAGALDRSTIISSCVSRFRPIMLAAMTTVAGMAPLLTDVFFQSMAVTIMGGLAICSILSLVSIPVVYALVHGKKVNV
jgi:multidrug efflux pump subunit AcrB